MCCFCLFAAALQLDEKQVRGILLDRHATLIANVTKELVAINDKYGKPLANSDSKQTAATTPIDSKQKSAAAAASGTPLTKRVAIELVPVIKPETELKISDLSTFFLLCSFCPAD